MATHNENKHPIATGYEYILWLVVVSVCVALSHYLSENWGVM